MKYRPDPLLPNSRHQSLKLLLNPPQKRKRRKAKRAEPAPPQRWYTRLLALVFAQEQR